MTIKITVTELNKTLLELIKGSFKKTGFTKPLSIDRFVLSAVQALELDEINLKLSVQCLVHVDEIVFKNQKVLDGVSDFRSHLFQDSFVQHIKLNVFILFENEC